MERKCNEAEMLMGADDAIVTEDQFSEVMDAHDAIAVNEEEVTLAGSEPEQTATEYVEEEARDSGTEDLRMMAFVKFVQQPDGSLAPVCLVQAEDISDKGNIVMDPMLVETAEHFSRSAIEGGQIVMLGEERTAARDGDAGPAHGAMASPGAAAAGPARSRPYKRRQVDMSKPVPCELCGSRYKTQASLRTHQRIYHQDSATVKTRDGLRCGEEGCDFTASHSKTLRNHLTQKHQIKMDIVKLIFRDWEEFGAWRRDFEAETGSRYRRYQRQLSDGQLVSLHLVCPGGSPTVYQRRAGWRRRARHGRLGRPPGGATAGAATRVSCTSFIRAARTDAASAVAVTVNTTHYGHTLHEPAGTGRLKEPMPEANRLFLEEKLRAGWTLDRILHEARLSVLAEPVPSNPMFRLQREHVYKVARRLGIATEQFRVAREPAVEEFAALRYLADQMTAAGEVHVLFHKEPGELMDGVHESDFVFAFSTPNQVELLHAHGTGVLMMDATDAPRGRPYRLTSVCAFDGDGDQPQPVAWMLSSASAKELALDLVHGLRDLSLRVRGEDVPVPRYFVAEKHSSFHQMWVEATGQRPLRLLDQARVRAALSTILIKHVEDAAERQEVWRTVSQLIAATGQEEQEGEPPPPRDQVAARRLVYRNAASLGRQLRARPSTKRFGAYLEEKWLKRGLIEEWQTLFRQGVRVPSRCPAQVFHEAVAAEFLTGPERRVDKAVAKLVEFSKKWHEPPPEKNAMAPNTMVKFFPQSAELWRSSDGGAGRPSEPDVCGSPSQLRRELRLRLEGLVNCLDAGLGAGALRAWRRCVADMEEAASLR
ncbi:uncharacterized protein LOC119092021 [Pollicipes pollicipes]|uniref:uncharacterized protein LOC119092021 n=1 Tax=Pollicipes pollicipes TaxID=41117 RepID=UPI0018856139|nr:uncharacterized protein LOC119092021 [Pollicipes pollicipes]